MASLVGFIRGVILAERKRASMFLRAANPRAPTAMASEPLYYCIMDICDCEFAQLQPSHEVSRRPLIATRCLSRIPQVR